MRNDKPAVNLRAGLDVREKYFDFFTSATLLAFGTYESVLYFGHKVVPIPDFPDIVRVGHELLAFKVPSTFKIAPVVGLLQAGLSHLVGGEYPDLTAGWLLNAALHPFTVLLFWLIGKRILGRSAAWFAIVAALNPALLYMLREPLIEAPLLFFVLLTVYLILKGSKWCYLFASITTMVRYEGTVLIVAAFVMDMIESRSRQERIHSLIYSVLATVPLIIWLGATALCWKSGTSHYFNVLFTKEYAKGFAADENRTGFLLNMKVLWETSFWPLLQMYPKASKDFTDMVWNLSKAGAFVGFFFGSIYGLCKRRWEILVMLIFLVPYFLLHTLYPYSVQRYYLTVFWIALLIVVFGFQSCWRIIDGDGRVPRRIIFTLQLMIILGACGWVLRLVGTLPKLAEISPRSASLPYVSIMLAGIICAGEIWFYRRLWREITVLSVICLVIVSNQFYLASSLGDGQADKEFKLLAQWYVANSKPGEKLAVYMSEVVRIFAPGRTKDIVGFPKADSPSGLVEACYEQGITYVVWASRDAFSKEHYNYRLLNLDKNITPLCEPRNTESYEFVTQIGSKRGYVNVFRLRGAGG